MDNLGWTVERRPGRTAVDPAEFTVAPHPGDSRRTSL